MIHGCGILDAEGAPRFEFAHFAEQIIDLAATGAQVGVGNPDGTITVDGGHADVSPVGFAKASRTA